MCADDEDQSVQEDQWEVPGGEWEEAVQAGGQEEQGDAGGELVRGGGAELRQQGWSAGGDPHEEQERPGGVSHLPCSRF